MHRECGWANFHSAFTEIARLKAKVGEITMANGLLEEKISAL